LTNGIDMAHVSDRRGYDFILIFNKVVELFIGRICSWNHMVFVKVRVVRTSCLITSVPKPLKRYRGWLRRLCTLRETVRINNNNRVFNTNVYSSPSSI
jgi:hypothetical protein